MRLATKHPDLKAMDGAVPPSGPQRCHDRALAFDDKESLKYTVNPTKHVPEVQSLPSAPTPNLNTHYVILVKSTD